MPPRPAQARWKAALFAALVLLFASAALAQQKERQLKKFYADILITPDGTVDVTENITFKFLGGPWHCIYRNIPVEYAGPNGTNYSLFLEVKSVRDENGNKLKFESS